MRINLFDSLSILLNYSEFLIRKLIYSSIYFIDMDMTTIYTILKQISIRRSMRSMSQIMRLHERAVQSYAEKLCRK